MSSQKNTTKIIPVLVTSLYLSSCTSSSGPAQIENRQNMIFTKHGTMEVVRVYPHDTIHSIAQQHNVPVEILAAANNLAYPYHLYNMRTLMIPQDKYHKVTKNNETLKALAKKYHVDAMQLMDINDMTHISLNQRLRLGTLIRIPTQRKHIKQHAEEDLAPAYSPSKDYDVMELDEVTPTVMQDDQPIAEEIQEKQIQPPANDEVAAFEKDLHDTLKDSTEHVAPAAVSNMHSGFKTITPLNLQQFIWPLSGKISREKKDGITIYSPLNTSIKAISNGKVIFAENDNGEYGNLIIIKHRDGYLSAYAHTNQMLVKKGEEVKKGQTIAKVGKSGKVSQPQLYFSMRQGKEIIDPEKDITTE